MIERNRMPLSCVFIEEENRERIPPLAALFLRGRQKGLSGMVSRVLFILQTFDPLIIELNNFFASLAFALLLANPFDDTLSMSGAFKIMRQLPEWSWAVYFLCLAVIKIFALCYGSKSVRRKIALLFFGTYVGMSAMFFVENSRGFAFCTFTVFSFFTLLIYLRLSGMGSPIPNVSDPFHSLRESQAEHE